MLEGIASGMDYMHDKRILHGDLNPNNVLLHVCLPPLVSRCLRSKPPHTGSTLTCCCSLCLGCSCNIPAWSVTIVTMHILVIKSSAAAVAQASFFYLPVTRLHVCFLSSKFYSTANALTVEHQ
jgi:hypothetical protein